MSKTEAQEVLSEHWEMFFTFMVTKPWHRLPGEVMKPLVFRDNQKLFGHSSGQVALGVPALAESLDKMTFRATFQHQLFYM